MRRPGVFAFMVQWIAFQMLSYFIDEHTRCKTIATFAK